MTTLPCRIFQHLFRTHSFQDEAGVDEPEEKRSKMSELPPPSIQAPPAPVQMMPMPMPPDPTNPSPGQLTAEKVSLKFHGIFVHLLLSNLLASALVSSLFWCQKYAVNFIQTFLFSHVKSCFMYYSPVPDLELSLCFSCRSKK